MNGRDGREPLLPKHGGYRRLKRFQVAQLAFDVTVRFCDRYIDRRSRTHDQMVQAARSGVQNIAEGSVAKANLEELRLDYEDFLRQWGLALWAPDDPRRKTLVARRCTSADEVAIWVRDHGLTPDGQTGLGVRSMPSMESMYSGAAANAALVPIGVAISLLDRQVQAQAAAFEQEGGFTERPYRTRQLRRRES